MTIDVISLPEPDVTCATCKANCCRLEVMLITDTGVPDEYIELDKWGGRTMSRLDDGWCAPMLRLRSIRGWWVLSSNLAQLYDLGTPYKADYNRAASANFLGITC